MNTNPPQSVGPVSTDALVVPTDVGYDRWSSIYDSEDNPLIIMETPAIERLLGEVRGLSVLDIGCGTGRHSIKLAAEGAIVTAIDFSEGMLAKARAKLGADKVRFIAHDLAKTLPLESVSFDRVLCSLVVEHIADLDPLFREMKRVCKPNGSVVISAMHPAMMLRGISARFTDPETGRETRPQSHPNQLSDFVMAAVRAGLVLDHLSEHAVDHHVAAKSPRSQKYLGWPMLFVMRLRPAKTAVG